MTGSRFDLAYIELTLNKFGDNMAVDPTSIQHRSVEIYCGFRFRSPLYSTAILNLNCSLLFSSSRSIMSFGRPKGPKGPAQSLQVE